MTDWLQLPETAGDDVSPTTGLRSPATVVCDHRPGVLAFLAAALSGAVVGGLVVLALLLLAAPRPAAQATARVDLFPGLSPARLTEAPRGIHGDNGAPIPPPDEAAAGVASSGLSSVTRSGSIAWASESHGKAYLALPLGPGHRVLLCGSAGCLVMLSTDAGPALSEQRQGRIADVAVGLWESAICGLPRRLGRCAGSWTVVERVSTAMPTLPPTDGGT